MKKFSSRITSVVLSIIAVSCSPEQEYLQKTDTAGSLWAKKAQLTPENIANVYDTVGKIHTVVLDLYYSANHSYSTVAEINTEAQYLAGSYGSTALGAVSTTPSPVGQIEGIISAPETSLEAIIIESYLSSPAKTSLTGFIDSLLLIKGGTYEELYQLIVDYESAVIANTVFNVEDKRVILTTTSVARHSIYYRKRRKDKDWETLVGNIAATVEGALDNPITAVSMALATGISQEVIAMD